MCIYGKIIQNPKYRPNKKNNGVVPEMRDNRVRYVPVSCGVCFECMKQKANGWKIRLAEEIRDNPRGKFVTLTFTEEALVKLGKKIKGLEGYALENEIATRAVRFFTERWRKKFKKAPRHWLITELGHEGTERIHLHGIIWADNAADIEERWNAGKYKYGWVWKEKVVNEIAVNYVNEETVGYMMKYVTKTDPKHKAYKPIILCSKGIGKGFINRFGFERTKYQGIDTKAEYVTESGHKVGLPIYYRNKRYTEEEREQLWLQRLDKNERWVGGEKVKADDDKEYYGLLEYYRRLNREMGYGSPEDWDVIAYENERRKLIQARRTEGYEE